MAFVLSPQDFSTYRRGTREIDAEIDRINRRTARKIKREAGVKPAPKDPFGLRLGPPPPTTQIGPTAADLEKQRLANAVAIPHDEDLPGETIGQQFHQRRAPGMQPQDPAPLITDSAKFDLSALDDQLKAGTAMPGLPPSPPPPTRLRPDIDPDAMFGLGVQRPAPVPGAITGALTPQQTESLRAFYKSPQVREIIARDPTIMIEIKGDPIAMAKEIQGIIDLQAGPIPLRSDLNLKAAEYTPPTQAVEPTHPGIVAVNPSIMHDTILYLESRNGRNPPKRRKGHTSSGNYGATDSTAQKHGIRGVYIAKNLTPGEKDKAAASVLDYYIRQWPDDPARVAIAYHFGTTAGTNWTGDQQGLIDIAKKAGTPPEEALRYVGTVMDRHGVTDAAQQAAGVRTPGTPAPLRLTIPRPALAAPVVPGTAPAPVTGVKVTQKSTGRKITLKGQEGGVTTAATSPSRQVATKTDVTKISEPSKNLSFGIRSQEMNKLLEQRESALRTAFIQSASLGDPTVTNIGLAAAFKEVDAATALIENMAQTQGLNVLELTGNPVMLNNILTHQNDRPIQISNNSDGTLRVTDNGVVVIESIASGKLVSKLRRVGSSEIHAKLKAATANAAAKEREAVIKHYFDTELVYTKENFEIIKELIKKAGVEQTDEGVIFTDTRGDRFLLFIGKGIDGETDVYKMIPLTPSNDPRAFIR